MKKTVVSVIAVFYLLTIASPVFSGESGTLEPPEKAHQKDECLLTARNCGYEVRSIQDKIEKLNEEIARGTTVYTREELDILKKKLEDVSRTLDFLLRK